MISFEQRGPRLLRRVLQRAAGIIPMSWIPAKGVVRMDRAFYRLTRGRTTFSAWSSGLPVIMLTTTGARSGQPRTVPVLGFPDGERLIVIASNFALPSHPGWYHNLRARPYATVSWQGSIVEMRARELSGEERQRYIDRSLEAYPFWEEYHRRAAPRQVPVIMLEQVDPAADPAAD